jgi:aspartate kinase
MSGSNGCCNSIVVVKLGGSILTSAKAYRRAARFLHSRLSAAPAERYVAVVSAQEGSTDSLERTARHIAPSPSARALHLLWSTGEIRSVALLTLHLESLGVAATPLNVHETGLHLAFAGDVAKGVTPAAARLHSALASSRVAVVPGFLGTDAGGSIVALGRGGSDLTAVLLAASLGAARCELIKDVPGYFSADPHCDAAARHLPALTLSEALTLANAGCDLVQRQAIEAAARTHLPIVVRSLDESAPITIVSNAGANATAHAAARATTPETRALDICHPEPALAGEGSAFAV